MSMRLLIVSAICLVALSALISLSRESAGTFAEAQTIAEDIADFNELKNRFQELSHDTTAVYGFEILRRATLPPHTDVHLLGHAIGEVLYEQRGIDGIADCTQDFRNACSHAIVIGALHEFGEAALPMIKNACAKAPGGSGAYTMCYHGFGHGVFAYFNYDLVETIGFCTRTGTSEYRDRASIECVGGAIMELMGGGGHNHAAWVLAREKYLDPQDPLSPCTDAVVPDSMKSICVLYLTPRLWELAGIDMGQPDPADFQKAFRYCNAIPKDQRELRNACYGGFGKEFYPLVAARDVRDASEYSDAQLATVVEWCGAALVTDGKQACIGDAVASAFWGGEKDSASSLRLCGAAESDSEMRIGCYEQLAANIEQYTVAPRRDELCAQIPEEFRTACLKE